MRLRIGLAPLAGPSSFGWGLSTIKNFKVTERQQFQFRFEAFNAANHPVWGNPNRNWSSRTATPAASFGQIRAPPPACGNYNSR